MLSFPVYPTAHGIVKISVHGIPKSTLSYWFLLGLSQGIIQKHLEDQDRRHFNQGIHRSLRNSLLLSVLGGGLFTGIVLLSMGLTIGLADGLGQGLSIGLREGLREGTDFWRSMGGREGLRGWPDFWLSISLREGLSFVCLLFLCCWFLLWSLLSGLTIVRHYTLRMLLARSNTFPFHARRFLDDAVTRVLLKRQGGGYAFVHRRLLDYCADTSMVSTREESALFNEGQPAVASG